MAWPLPLSDLGSEPHPLPLFYFIALTALHQAVHFTHLSRLAPASRAQNMRTSRAALCLGYSVVSPQSLAHAWYTAGAQQITDSFTPWRDG